MVPTGPSPLPGRAGSVARRAYRDRALALHPRADPRPRRAPRPAGRQLRQRLADLVHRRAGDRVAAAPGLGVPPARRRVALRPVGRGGRQPQRRRRPPPCSASAARPSRSPRCGRDSSASPRTATTSSRWRSSPAPRSCSRSPRTATDWWTTTRSATPGSAPAARSRSCSCSTSSWPAEPAQPSRHGGTRGWS